MPIKFRCPNCRQKYGVDQKHAGRKIRCEKCNAKLLIPEASTATGQTAPDEGGGHDETSRQFRKPP